MDQSFVPGSNTRRSSYGSDPHHTDPRDHSRGNYRDRPGGHHPSRGVRHHGPSHGRQDAYGPSDRYGMPPDGYGMSSDGYAMPSDGYSMSSGGYCHSHNGYDPRYPQSMAHDALSYQHHVPRSMHHALQQQQQPGGPPPSYYDPAAAAAAAHAAHAAAMAHQHHPYMHLSSHHMYGIPPHGPPPPRPPPGEPPPSAPAPPLPDEASVPPPPPPEEPTPRFNDKHNDKCTAQPPLPSGSRPPTAPPAREAVITAPSSARSAAITAALTTTTTAAKNVVVSERFPTDTGATWLNAAGGVPVSRRWETAAAAAAAVKPSSGDSSAHGCMLAEEGLGEAAAAVQSQRKPMPPPTVIAANRRLVKPTMLKAGKADSSAKPLKLSLGGIGLLTAAASTSETDMQLDEDVRQEVASHVVDMESATAVQSASLAEMAVWDKAKSGLSNFVDPVVAAAAVAASVGAAAAIGKEMVETGPLGATSAMQQPTAPTPNGALPLKQIKALGATSDMDTTVAPSATTAQVHYQRDDDKRGIITDNALVVPFVRCPGAPPGGDSTESLAPQLKRRRWGPEHSSGGSASTSEAQATAAPVAAATVAAVFASGPVPAATQRTGVVAVAQVEAFSSTAKEPAVTDGVMAAAAAALLLQPLPQQQSQQQQVSLVQAGSDITGAVMGDWHHPVAAQGGPVDDVVAAWVTEEAVKAAQRLAALATSATPPAATASGSVSVQPVSAALNYGSGHALTHGSSARDRNCSDEPSKADERADGEEGDARVRGKESTGHREFGLQPKPPPQALLASTPQQMQSAGKHGREARRRGSSSTSRSSSSGTSSTSSDEDNGRSRSRSFSSKSTSSGGLHKSCSTPSGSRGRLPRNGEQSAHVDGHPPAAIFRKPAAFPGSSAPQPRQPLAPVPGPPPFQQQQQQEQPSPLHPRLHEPHATARGPSTERRDRDRVPQSPPPPWADRDRCRDWTRGSRDRDRDREQGPLSSARDRESERDRHREGSRRMTAPLPAPPLPHLRSSRGGRGASSSPTPMLQPPEQQQQQALHRWGGSRSPPPHLPLGPSRRNRSLSPLQRHRGAAAVVGMGSTGRYARAGGSGGGSRVFGARDSRDRSWVADRGSRGGVDRERGAERYGGPYGAVRNERRDRDREWDRERPRDWERDRDRDREPLWRRAAGGVSREGSPEVPPYAVAVAAPQPPRHISPPQHPHRSSRAGGAATCELRAEASGRDSQPHSPHEGLGPSRPPHLRDTIHLYGAGAATTTANIAGAGCRIHASPARSPLSQTIDYPEGPPVWGAVGRPSATPQRLQESPPSAPQVVPPLPSGARERVPRSRRQSCSGGGGGTGRRRTSSSDEGVVHEMEVDMDMDDGVYEGSPPRAFSRQPLLPLPGRHALAAEDGPQPSADQSRLSPLVRHWSRDMSWYPPTQHEPYQQHDTYTYPQQLGYQDMSGGEQYSSGAAAVVVMAPKSPSEPPPPPPPPDYDSLPPLPPLASPPPLPAPTPPRAASALARPTPPPRPTLSQEFCLQLEKTVFEKFRWFCCASLLLEKCTACGGTAEQLVSPSAAQQGHLTSEAAMAETADALRRLGELSPYRWQSVLEHNLAQEFLSVELGAEDPEDVLPAPLPLPAPYACGGISGGGGEEDDGGSPIPEFLEPLPLTDECRVVPWTPDPYRPPVDLRVRQDDPGVGPLGALQPEPQPLLLFLVDFQTDEKHWQPWHVMRPPLVTAAAAAAPDGTLYGLEYSVSAPSAADRAAGRRDVALVSAAGWQQPEAGVFRFPQHRINQSDRTLLCSEVKAMTLSELRELARAGGSRAPVWGCSIQRVADKLWLPLTPMPITAEELRWVSSTARLPVKANAGATTEGPSTTSPAKATAAPGLRTECTEQPRNQLLGQVLGASPAGWLAEASASTASMTHGSPASNRSAIEALYNRRGPWLYSARDESGASTSAPVTNGGATWVSLASILVTARSGSGSRSVPPPPPLLPSNSSVPPSAPSGSGVIEGGWREWLHSRATAAAAAAVSSTIVCTAADGADGITSAAASSAAAAREAAPQKQRPPPPPPHVLAELRYDLYFDTHKGLVSKVLRPLLQEALEARDRTSVVAVGVGVGTCSAAGPAVAGGARVVTSGTAAAGRSSTVAALSSGAAATPPKDPAVSPASTAPGPVLGATDGIHLACSAGTSAMAAAGGVAAVAAGGPTVTSLPSQRQDRDGSPSAIYPPPQHQQPRSTPTAAAAVAAATVGSDMTTRSAASQPSVPSPGPLHSSPAGPAVTDGAPSAPPPPTVGVKRALPLSEDEPPGTGEPKKSRLMFGSVSEALNEVPVTDPRAAEARKAHASSATHAAPLYPSASLRAATPPYQRTSRWGEPLTPQASNSEAAANSAAAAVGPELATMLPATEQMAVDAAQPEPRSLTHGSVAQPPSFKGRSDVIHAHQHLGSPSAGYARGKLLGAPTQLQPLSERLLASPPPPPPHLSPCAHSPMSPPMRESLPRHPCHQPPSSSTEPAPPPPSRTCASDISSPPPMLWQQPLPHLRCPGVVMHPTSRHYSHQHIHPSPQHRGEASPSSFHHHHHHHHQTQILTSQLPHPGSGRGIGGQALARAEEELMQERVDVGPGASADTGAGPAPEARNSAGDSPASKHVVPFSALPQQAKRPVESPYHVGIRTHADTAGAVEAGICDQAVKKVPISNAGRAAADTGVEASIPPAAAAAAATAAASAERTLDEGPPAVRTAVTVAAMQAMLTTSSCHGPLGTDAVSNAAAPTVAANPAAITTANTVPAGPAGGAVRAAIDASTAVVPSPTAAVGNIVQAVTCKAAIVVEGPPAVAQLMAAEATKATVVTTGGQAIELEEQPPPKLDTRHGAAATTTLPTAASVLESSRPASSLVTHGPSHTEDSSIRAQCVGPDTEGSDGRVLAPAAGPLMDSVDQVDVAAAAELHRMCRIFAQVEAKRRKDEQDIYSRYIARAVRDMKRGLDDAFDKDPSELPEYREIVEQPMYLREIQRKQKKKEYGPDESGLWKLKADFVLIAVNAELYNRERPRRMRASGAPLDDDEEKELKAHEGMLVVAKELLERIEAVFKDCHDKLLAEIQALP